MTLNFPDSPVDGQVYDRYVWVESRGVWKALENSDYTLANLDDVNVDSVQDGESLVYDNATSSWIPGTSFNISDVIVVSDTQPTSANEGNLWFDTTVAKLYIYYFDGNNFVWVGV